MSDTTSGNEWQRVTANGTRVLHQVTTSSTMSDN